MTAASAHTCRRGRAAAGEHPPRRPRAALTALTALTALAATCAALTACASTATPAASPAPGNVFTTRQMVSLQQVRTEIGTLYSDHPGIASFAVQDVQYTASSRDTVLSECTAGTATTASSAGTASTAGSPGTASTTGTANGTASQAAETGQIIACAPMIFFLYSYGKQSEVPAAITVAGHLYWYAITHISGPLNPRTSLDELLQSWKLPVPSLTPAEASRAVAASVITAAGDEMLTQKSVRVVIADHTPGAASAQRITADIGTVTGSELITYGASSAAIRVTRRAAYFAGDSAGLAAYLGLSRSAAARVGSRWVMIKAGTSEYKDLAAENTIAQLPSSILPSAAEVSRVRSTTIGGQKAYVLEWKATASGSGATIEVRLTLAAAPKVLPLSETLTTNGESKTVTFSRWGIPFTVTAPAPVVPYSLIGG